MPTFNQFIYSVYLFLGYIAYNRIILTEEEKSKVANEFAYHSEANIPPLVKYSSDGWRKREKRFKQGQETLADKMAAIVDPVVDAIVAF